MLEGRQALLCPPREGERANRPRLSRVALDEWQKHITYQRRNKPQGHSRSPALRNQSFLEMQIAELSLVLLNKKVFELRLGNKNFNKLLCKFYFLATLKIFVLQGHLGP